MPPRKLTTEMLPPTLSVRPGLSTTTRQKILTAPVPSIAWSANALLNVIVPALPEMKERLATSGVLILSGLLSNDRDEILQRLTDLGFEVREEMTENEWIALVVSRYAC